MRTRFSMKTSVAACGHWIEPRRPERVASAQSDEPQPPSADHAVEANRLGRVIGTGRMKTARAGEQRRQQQFVAAQQRQRGARRDSRLSSGAQAGAGPRTRHTRPRDC